MTFEITAGSSTPVGQYVAALLQVTIEKGQFGDFRKWLWVADKDGESVEITAVSSTNTGPGSKSYQWLTAHLGQAPKIGDKVDPIGKRVVITVGEDDKNPGKGFTKVVSVAPYMEPQQVMDGVPR